MTLARILVRNKNDTDNPSPKYGPRSSITCPVWAVHIAPGTTIQTVVNANSAGTTYCLEVGIHRQQTIAPKSGDTFIGEYGAVLNGSAVLTGWVQDGSRYYVTGQTQQGTVNDLGGLLCDASNPLCAVPEDVFFDNVPLAAVASVGVGGTGKFYFDYAADTISIWDNPSGHVVETSITPTAFTLGSATNVAIYNLIIEKYATPTNSYTVELGTGWLLDACEVRYDHYVGVRTLSNSIARYNHIHHNGGYGITGIGSNVLIEGNEISYNNYALLDPYFGSVTKFVFTEDLILRRNFSHHNHGNGLWCDISNNNTIYEYNTVEDNYLCGIFHEISYAAVIRYNVCKRNGLAQDFGEWSSGAGINVTRSADVEVYENDLYDNWQGIMALDDNRNDAQNETHGPWDMVNLNVHDNRIRQSTDLGSGSGNSGIVQAGGAGSAPFEAGANNHFENNDYWLGSYTNYFLWSTGNVDEAAWVAFGHDETGSFTRAFALVAKVAAGSVAGATVTTPGVNTTGATILIVTIADGDDGGFGTISDNKDNTSWVPLTVRTNGAFGTRNRMYYHLNPVVGAGHTFTYTISSSFQYPSINALAFSGSHASPFDVENGAIGGTSPMATGSVTPSLGNELVVSGMAFDSPASAPTIDNGFTVGDIVAQVGGNHYGGASAYKIQPAAAVNPSWSWTGGSAGVTMTIATFKPTAG